MAAFIYATVSAGEFHQSCSMVCLELCKSYSEHYPNIEVCNNHCCPADPFTAEVADAIVPSQEQNQAVTSPPNDVHGGPNRDPNCNLDMFNQC